MVGRLHGKVWGLDLKITSVSLLGQNFWGRWTRLRTMYSDEDVTCVFLLQHNYGIIVLYQIV